MKQILLDRYGTPEEVTRCADVPDVGPPGPGEVVFEVLLFPINPTDVWFCKGESPTEARTSPQAAMVRINPPTALLMLTDLVDLEPGDWVLQNVANSAVGRLLIPLARARGLRTVNVVRRESLVAELTPLGADACVVDGPSLPEQVKAATGGTPIRLGIDAVGGPATARIGACVADGGTVCTYGSMSGEDPVMRRGDLIFRRVTLVGFSFGTALARRSSQEVRALYADLAAQIMAGTLHVPVEKIYPIEEIRAALRHAQQGERRGKILVAPNGPVV